MELTKKQKTRNAAQIISNGLERGGYGQNSREWVTRAYSFLQGTKPRAILSFEEHRVQNDS